MSRVNFKKGLNIDFSNNNDTNVLSHHHGCQVLLVTFDTHRYLCFGVSRSTMSQHNHLPLPVIILASCSFEPIKEIRLRKLTSG